MPRITGWGFELVLDVDPGGDRDLSSLLLQGGEARDPTMSRPTGTSTSGKGVWPRPRSADRVVRSVVTWYKGLVDRRYRNLIWVLAAVAAPASLVYGVASGSTSHHGGCGRPWPAVTGGQPGSAPAGPSVNIWRSGRLWHARVGAAGARSAVTATIAGDARVRVLTSRPAGAARLSESRRTLAVNARAGRTGRVDFDPGCATQLSFSAHTATSQPVPVLLGSGTTAPGQASRVSRPASTGVYGRLLRASGCPVIGPQGCRAAQPLQGTVRIETAGSRTVPTARGQLVARVASDSRGNYHATLAPGRYQLTIDNPPPGSGFARPEIVDVVAGVVTRADLVLDSGIR